jgi:outer membrane protein assembly factor BamB
MKRRSTLFVALAACNSSFATPVSEAPTDKESQIITDELRKMNGDDFGKPSSQFNAGTVSARKAPAAHKTKTGYEIKFGNGSAVSTPAVYKGKVYTSGGFNSREFYAFEANTGKSTFGLDLSDDGPSSGACEDGTCVFNTESCTVFAVDAETGKRRWAWFLGDPQTSSPTIAAGRVFTTYPAGAVTGKKPRPPAASHVLAAFDLKTGKVAWQDWLDADVISAPVAVGEFLYVATYNGTVVKLEQATGKIRYASKAHATSAPVVQFQAGLESMYYTRRADQVNANPARTAKAGAHATPAAKPAAEEQIVRTDHNEPVEKYATEAKRADYLDGEVQDKSAMKTKSAHSDAGNGFSGGAPAAAAPHKAMAQVGQSNVASIQQFQGSRILHLSNLNVNTMGDEVIATNPEDGKQLWSHKLSGDVAKDGGFLGAPPVAAGKHVIVATLHGSVIELDPVTGKVEQTFEVGGTLRSQPVVADGWIYVGTDDGRLVAIDTGDRSLTGWPMWGGNAQRTGMTGQ